MRAWPLLVVLAACASAPPTPPPSEDPVGPEVDLRLPALQGGDVVLPDDLRGFVVLVDVWATWCAPCRRSLPAWADMQRRLGPEGLAVLAVSIDDDPADVPPFVEELGLPLRVLLDPGAGRTAPALGFDRVPTVALVDRRGRLRFLQQGWSDDHPAQVEAAARRLLAEGRAPP